MEVSIQSKSRKVISNGMLGMLFLIATEIMLFAAFISAYIVNKAMVPAWPPPGQPRLPIEVTGLNSIFLLASGVTLFIFSRKFGKSKTSGTWLNTTILLGLLFLVIQGGEWVKLIGFGLTTSSSIYGAFFYMIIGAHALHVLIGLVILYYLFNSLKKHGVTEENKSRIAVYSLFWYFVVAIWPILYVLVYLN